MSLRRPYPKCLQQASQNHQCHDGDNSPIKLRIKVVDVGDNDRSICQRSGSSGSYTLVVVVRIPKVNIERYARSSYAISTIFPHVPSANMQIQHGLYYTFSFIAVCTDHKFVCDITKHMSFTSPFDI
jgi:hypothetical protein